MTVAIEAKAVPPARPRRIFMAPARYVQGPGVLHELAEQIAPFGRSPVLILDAGIAASVHARLASPLSQLPAKTTILEFGSEVTRAGIDALAEHARASGPDLVVGIGGGKTLDAAKGVALRMSTPFFAIPTIASTDAPASRGLVLYREDHRWDAVEELPTNPVCVLVDTQWIVQAPHRYLAAGIGDAIGKKFEVEACHAAGGLNKHGAPASLSALALADACYRALREHAAPAMRCFEQGRPDAHFEATVEACLLMSALAFENGGLSVAHAVTIGFPGMRGLAGCLHGEHVAYGTLVQLALQDAPDTLHDLAAFYRELGLPTSLADMGMSNPGPQEIEQLAHACHASPRPKNHLAATDVQSLIRAIRQAEAMARALKPARAAHFT